MQLSQEPRQRWKMRRGWNENDFPFHTAISTLTKTESTQNFEQPHIYWYWCPRVLLRYDAPGHISLPYSILLHVNSSLKQNSQTPAVTYSVYHSSSCLENKHSDMVRAPMKTPTPMFVFTKFRISRWGFAVTVWRTSLIPDTLTTYKKAWYGWTRCLTNCRRWCSQR